MKILILGSMSFSEEMKETEIQLKSFGHEVELPLFLEDYLKLNSSEEMHAAAVENKNKYDLFKEYFELIKKVDAILILNKEKKGIKNYIRGNALIEMSYAHILNKKIFLLEEIPNLTYTDEIKAMHPIALNGDLSLIK